MEHMARVERGPRCLRGHQRFARRFTPEAVDLTSGAPYRPEYQPEEQTERACERGQILPTRDRSQASAHLIDGLATRAFWSRRGLPEHARNAVEGRQCR